MRKNLIASAAIAALALLAAAPSFADAYVSAGLRALDSTKVTVGVGYDTEIGRSGVIVGAQLDQSLGQGSFGNYRTVTGSVGYKLDTFTPYVRAGKVQGSAADGNIVALGLEYTSSPQPTGWSLVGEIGRVKDAESSAKTSTAAVYTRYRF